MAKRIPFDDDTMTLIMGLGGPDKSGQHGRTTTMAPGQDAIDTITQIRDLCEEFLMNAGKESDEEEKPEKEEEAPEMNDEEE